jgi:hypothetical protein
MSTPRSTEVARKMVKALTGGTNHFAHAGSPADKARAAEYEAGPYTGFADQVLKSLAAIVPADADVSAVAAEEKVTQLISGLRGKADAAHFRIIILLT